jgi:autotransporter-associated beta strand protein
MNRVYRLVWNRSLATLQVASELARAQGGHASGGGAARAPRCNALAVALAGLALACATTPAWSQTCTPTDPSGCGAPGGIGTRQTRSPNGGAGNGTGGDATLWIGNTTEGVGGTASAGNGGGGAIGIFAPDATIDVFATGGAGGNVGATGSAGVNATVNGGTGGNGEAAADSDPQSLVGGGGGGGGAGVFINDAGSLAAVGSTTTIQGGNGGNGGDALASSSNGNATNGDPGAGGGGGAGIIVAAGAGSMTLGNSGTIRGGYGGTGGNGGYAGSGGGGGDGVLMLGTNSVISNSSGGRIYGGAGGNPGSFQDGTNEPGGYGGGGAGVNVVGANNIVTNDGTIIGGSASANSANVADFAAQNGTAGAGVSIVGANVDLTNAGTIIGGSITGSSAGNSGTPGAGVIVTGSDATVTNSGHIFGGTAGTTQADAVLFSGGGDVLIVDGGATFSGNVESRSGGTNGGDTLILGSDANGILDAGQIINFAHDEKTGNSTWTLIGTGHANIDWFVEQGVLSGDTSSLAGNLFFNNNNQGISPVVEFDQGGAGTFSGSILGAGEIDKEDAGTLTFASSSNLSGFVGLFQINTGGVTLDNNGNLQGAEIGGFNYQFDISGITSASATVAGISGNGNVSLGANTLQLISANNGNFSGAISGTGGVTLAGGTQIFSGGNNSYSGDTTVNPNSTLKTVDAGQIGLGNSRLELLGTLDASGMTPGSTLLVRSLDGNGTLSMGDNALEIRNALATDTFSGVISGSDGIVLDAGTQTLLGVNTYSGDTIINGGTLKLVGAAQIGNGQSRLESLGGSFDISGLSDHAVAIESLDGNASVQLGGNTLIIDNASDAFSGTISGSGGVTLNSGNQGLNGNNSYSGTTLISGGTLTFGSNGTISNSSVQIDSGTLDLSGLGNGSSLSFVSLASTGSGITNGNGNVNLANAGIALSDASGIYDGIISGAGTVAILGGTEQLNGVNTYTGLTSVASGAGLLVGDSAHTAAEVAGDVSVSGGMLGGYGTVAGSVVLSNGASLTPGAAAAVGTLTVDGDLTIGSGSQLNFDFGAPGPNFSTPGQSDHVVVQGSLSIDTSTLNVDNLGSMGPGLYNLFQWGNTLSITGGGFAPPSGMSLQILTVDKQINLVDTQSVTLDEWDANGLAGPSQMGGGSGTWSLYSNTWSDTTGQYVGPMAPEPGFAIFGGAAGTVTVDDSNGNVGVTGMQFVSDGYRLTGDTIDLVGQNGVAPVLRVSSGDTAVIDNVLDGVDGFNKTDGGTLVLTGSNIYTGVTTLSGGYLSVSSDINLGNSANPLDFEGGTLEITGTAFNQTSRAITWGSPGGGFDIDDVANTFTVAQALTGTGGLLKSGAGTLVLSGANTYSGGTIIDAGTLQGDSTSLQGNITNNATLVFAQNSNGTFTGAITGSGQLIKNGSGTLSLNGANAYTGGTTISAGTLQGDSTSLQGNILDNATLVFDQATDGTYSGTISGSGSVNKTGTGALTLTAANTYTGGTTISAGTLQGDTNSLHGDIADNATLQFDQTSDGTYTGTISGSGVVSKIGAGTLALSGNNSFAGGIVVQGGTLAFAADANLGATTGSITLDGGTLENTSAWTTARNVTLGNGGGTMQTDAAATVSGIISGAGALTKTGAGTLILDGINTYTGTTTVSAGTLEIGDANATSASIASDVDVQAGGTLRGHGTITGNVTNDGIVWPGGSMGTLAIQGNYTQNADGTLQIDVTPTQSSLLKVSGTATLGGTLDLIFAPGTYSANTFNLVQAGAVSGTFSTVNGTVPGTAASQISYSAADAQLVLSQTAPSHPVVEPLDGSLFGNLMRSVNLTGQQDMDSVLDAGVISRDTPCGADNASHMQNVTNACSNGAWAQYTGSSISLNGANGSNSTAFGLLGGADFAVGDVVHLGVQAGVGQVNGNDTTGGNGRVDNVHGGLYAYADAGPLVLSGVVDAMHSDYHFNRTTGIGMATSAPSGNMQSAGVQAAWPLQVTQWQLTPKLGALYQRQTLGGFAETLNSTNALASSFPVDGARSRYTSLQPYALLAIDHRFVASGVTYLPELSLGYRYDTHNAATPIVQVAAQDGTVFDLPAATQARGMGTVNARITAQAGASWSLYANYQGFFGSGLRDNALSVGFTKHF